MTTYTPLAAAMMLAATIASAADWPQYRGPQRNDISTETGLLKKWPADDVAFRLGARQIIR